MNLFEDLNKINMYREKDLLKSAKLHTNRCTRFQKSLVDNKMFADSAVSQKREYSAKTKLKLLTSTNIDKNKLALTYASAKNAMSYNPASDTSGTMFDTLLNNKPKFSFINKKVSECVPVVTKRPFSENSKETIDVSKLSNINNFQKFYGAEVNTIYNSVVCNSAVKKRVQSKIVDIEQGIPRENKPSTTSCPFQTIKVEKSSLDDSIRINPEIKSFLNDLKIINNEQRINYIINRASKYQQTNTAGDKGYSCNPRRINRLIKKEYSPNTETKQILFSRNHKLKAVFSKEPEDANKLFYYKQKIPQRPCIGEKCDINLSYKGNHDFVKAFEENPMLFRRTRGMCNEQANYMCRTQHISIKK